MNLTQLKDHFSGSKKSTPVPGPIPIYAATIINGDGDTHYCALYAHHDAADRIIWSSASANDLKCIKKFKVITQKFLVVGIHNTGTKNEPHLYLKVVDPAQIDKWKGTPFEGDAALVEYDAESYYIEIIDWEYIAFTRHQATIAANELRRYFGTTLRKRIAKMKAETKTKLQHYTALEKIFAKF